jgi:hypothetical protein
MARNPFFFFAIFVALFPLAFSCSLSETATYMLLDISAALQQAQAILSFNPKTVKPLDQQQVQQILSNSSSFWLKLHAWDSLYKTSRKDYKSQGGGSLVPNSLRPPPIYIYIYIYIYIF